MTGTTQAGPKRKLGEVLVDAGVIDDLQLRSALGHQRQWGGRLGHILVDMKVIDEFTLAQTLAGQLGLELCGLDADIDIEVVRLLPQNVAERHAVFPVRFDSRIGGGTLTVAFSDPTNLAAIDEVRFQTGKTIQLAVASEGQIALAIRRYYYGEDPSAAQPAVAPDQLFGGVEGFLSSDDEDELAELEPISTDSQAGRTNPLGAHSPTAAIPIKLTPVPLVVPPPAVLTNDPLAGFLDLSQDSVPPLAVIPPRGSSRPPSMAPEAPPVLQRSASKPNPLPSSPSSPRTLVMPPAAPRPTPAVPADLGRAKTHAAFEPPAVPEPPPDEGDDFLSQAVDLHKETVQGYVLPPDFLAHARADTPVPPSPPTPPPVAPPPRPSSISMNATREIPVFSQAMDAFEAGESIDIPLEATRPGVDVAALLQSVPSQTGRLDPTQSTQPDIKLDSLKPTPPSFPPSSPLPPSPASAIEALDAAFDITFGEPSQVRPNPLLSPPPPAPPTPAAPPASKPPTKSTKPPAVITPAPPSRPPVAPMKFDVPELSPSPASIARAEFAPEGKPQFSEDDLGAALSGLDEPPGEMTREMTTFSPKEADYARALVRLLIKKGLIDEAELLAELSARDSD